MNDMLWAAAMLGLLSFVAFRTGQALNRNSAGWATVVVGASAVAVILIYGIYCHEQLWLSRLVPVSSAIVLCNVIPPASLLLAGLVTAQSAVAPSRRRAMAMFIALLACSTVARYFVAFVPQAGEPWYSRDVCMQTVSSSCSACSAASLLRYHGIQATEREMMDLCLTNANGTPPLGLYRGLKRKTQGSDHKVLVLHEELNELVKDHHLPAVLLLNPQAFSQPVSGHADWSLVLARRGHAVILYRITAKGTATIGDPSSGVAHWPIQDLAALYQGDAICLVKK